MDFPRYDEPLGLSKVWEIQLFWLQAALKVPCEGLDKA